MKVQFELTIGENKFTLIEDVESHVEFFKKLNFYSTLPKQGPNGETDLVLRHRLATTQAGKKVDYYSIVSEKAQQEFKFGQSQQVPGGLFPKGWEPLFKAQQGETTESDDAQASQPATGGLGATSQAPKPASTGGLGSATKTAAPTPTPAAQPVSTPTQTPPPPAVAAQASNVLAKFGI